MNNDIHSFTRQPSLLTTTQQPAAGVFHSTKTMLLQPAEANNFIVLDILKFIAVATSLVNVAVYAQRSMRRQPLLQYMFVMSIADAAYTLGMTMFLGVGVQCNYEELNNHAEDADLKICFVFYWYLVLVPDYLTSCLSLFNILIEILVTCQRIVMISQGARSIEKAARPFLVSSLLLALSLAVYVPVLFMNTVVTVETRNETLGVVRREYDYTKTQFGRSAEALFVEKSLSTIRVFLVSVVLTVVNIIAYVKYNSFFKRKMDMTVRLNARKASKEFNANRKMTLMLIIVSFLYIFGYIPYLVSYLIRLIYGQRIMWLARVATCAIYVLIILKTFVYYNFNSVFRRIVNNFFVRCFCWWRKNYSPASLQPPNMSMQLGE